MFRSAIKNKFTVRLLGVLGVALLANSVIAAAEPSAVQTKQVGTTDALAENIAAIAAKQTEISALDAKIKELQGLEVTSQQQAELIASRLDLLKQDLARAKLEVRQTNLAIASVENEAEETKRSIEEANLAAGTKKNILRQLLRRLYEQEQQSPWHVFLTSQSLSQAFAEEVVLQDLQKQNAQVVQELHAEIDKLTQEEAALARHESDLAALHKVQVLQQHELTAQETEQARVLGAKKEEQAKYEQKLSEARAARKEIEQDIFTLQGAGVKLTLTEATDMAKFASSLTGVRPALLMAVLKVESGVGTNIGSGKYPDDMHPASREPFKRITAKLGLDPLVAPISRSQSYGWGGAMGPAQIMPQTWETIEPRLAGLLHKSLPNPYIMTDAFVATAVLLADRGGATAAGEQEAVGRYLAGPNWQKYSQWYIDRVMAVAAEYEQAD